MSSSPSSSSSSSTAAKVARGGSHSLLSDDVLAELRETAAFLCQPGKGFLASDESAGPWGRCGHSEAKKIPDTLEARASYRSMLYVTPGLSEHISGVILHKETLFQKDAQGNRMVDLITSNGMIPGLKVDEGYDKAGMVNTAVGPLGHPETFCRGLDTLEARCAAAYKQGARFAKWRNVLQIDPEKGLPSRAAVSECVHSLARYAAICQRQRLVPIVEPEIVPNGSHDVYVCAEVTERVLQAQFAALQLHGVYLEGMVLKPNMVKNGLEGPAASPEEIADLTVQTLRRTVPPAMPGIFFLSGETRIEEDNEETATRNLNNMNRRHKGSLPWTLSFSFGKALQKTCIVTWMAKQENVPRAQAALLARARANSEAVNGVYVEGSCGSVGAAGNIQAEGGAY